jgi:glycosyltransferase involved in cell wall biosynthesis
VRPPRLSIVTPVFNPPPDVLRATLDSVRAQTSGNWEHWLVDDGSTTSHVRPMLEEAAAADSRVHVEFRSEQGGIVAATNDAVARSQCDFVAFLDHDDMLASAAVEAVTNTLAREPDCDYLYTDEDKIDLAGTHSDPFLKPDWSPERMRSQMYTCHLSVVRRSLLDEIGGLRTGYDGSQDWDVVLRVTERARHVVHVPEVLYHWRVHSTSVALDPMAKPYAHPAGRRAIQDHIDRTGLQVEVVEYEGLPGSNRILPRLREEPLVSIIIPTAGRYRVVHGMRTNLVVHAVHSIVERTTYGNYEIVVVADSDTPDATIAELHELAGERLRVVPFDRPFNYSAKINVGAVHARGEYLLTLNDDVEVLARGWKKRGLDDVGPSDWLECLLGYATHPDIGSVGAKMYLGDRRLQHVGIISTSASVPAHPYRGFHGNFVGYVGNALMPCNYIAVTGACLMTRKAVFVEVGGMSAAFPVNYQDVDYGLKLRGAGYRTVHNPEVELFHFESSSRAPDVEESERALLRARWASILAQDPYYHPGFVEHYADFVHPHYTNDGRFIATSPAA